MKAERMCQLFPTSPIHQSVTTNEPIHQVQRVGGFSIQKSLLGKTMSTLIRMLIQLIFQWLVNRILGNSSV